MFYLEWIQIALLLVFGAVLGMLSLELYNKTIITLSASLVAYILLFLYEGIKFEVMIDFINFNVLAIFLSIMVIIGVVTNSGFFQFIAVRTVKTTRGNLDVLYYLISIITFIVGILLLNIVSILMIASVTLTIAAALKTDAKNFLITEVILIDMGAMSLVFGSIPNILISNIAKIPITYFAIYILPFALTVVSTTLIILPKVFKGFPEIDPIRKLALLELNEYNMIRDEKSLIMSGLVLLYLIFGFALFPDPSIIAVSAALILIVATGLSPNRIRETIDWETFFFLVGLFLLVGSLDHVGIIELISEALYPIIKTNAFLGMLIILWSAGILSGILDNIALTLIYIPLIRDLSPAFGIYSYFVWIALILGTNLGGEVTPIGSPTTLITMGFAKEHGIDISFKEFLFYGFMISFINLTIATLYLTYIFFIAINLSIIPFIATSLTIFTIMLYIKIIAPIRKKHK